MDRLRDSVQLIPGFRSRNGEAVSFKVDVLSLGSVGNKTKHLGGKRMWAVTETLRRESVFK